MISSGLFTVLLLVCVVLPQVQANYARLPCNRVKNSPMQRWSSMFKDLKDGDQVEIPCGSRVVLDTLLVPRLSGLTVNGYLYIPARRGMINITTDYVLVQGHFETYGRKHGFRSDSGVQVTLTDSGNDLRFERDGKMINLGRKVFAVVGGRMLTNGMGGGTSCTGKTWTRLARSIPKGSKDIVLDGDLVRCWKTGDRIVVSSTSRDFKEAEERTIIRLRRSGGMTYATVDEPFLYDHSGLSEKFMSGGRMVEQAAEVGLLTRHVVIRGEKNPYRPLDGGHFIVHETRTRQDIIGVEFENMGQQGAIGRYPCHFHMCGSMRSSIFLANSVHNSNQRGVVIHGTHNLRVEDNVFHMITGHGVVLEDSIETGNVIRRNVGFRNDRPRWLINVEGRDESDHIPSMYWITNPMNDFIDNVASGSIFSGFWFELSHHVRGESRNTPGAADIDPVTLPLGNFSGNVAHSNANHGFRTYPNGYHPDSPVIFHNLQAWKNEFGIFLHRSQNIAIVDSVLANNQEAAVDFNEVFDCSLRNSLVVGRSGPGLACPKFGAVRVFGIAWQGSTGGTILEDVKLDKFAACTEPIVHFASEPNQYGIFQASSALVRVEALDRDSESLGIGRDAPSDYNRMSLVALRVEDTSFTGQGKSGYIVENRPILLPPIRRGAVCSPYGQTARFCANTCYRTVNLFFIGPPSSYRLRITRLVDNVVELGPIYNIGHSHVELYANLLTGYEYRIEILANNAVHVPRAMSIGYGDGMNACRGGVTIIFPHHGVTWGAFSGYPAEPKPCNRNAAKANNNAFLYYDRCSSAGIERVIDLPPVPIVKVGNSESYATMYATNGVGAPTEAICTRC